MPGRKRELEELRARVDLCERAHGPYAPLAEEIDQRVTQAAAQFSTNVDTTVETIVQDLTRERALALVRETFEQLPAEERLAALGRYFGDAVMQAALAEQRNRLVAVDETQRGIDALRADFKAFGRVDLARVPKDAVLSVRLHDLNDFQYSTKDVFEMCRPDRTLKARSLAGGMFHVLSDKIHFYNPEGVSSAYTYHESTANSHHRSPKLEVHQVVELGGALGQNDLPHAVYFGTKLNSRVDEDIRLFYTDAPKYRVDLGIGRLMINDTEIIGPSTML